MPDGLGLALPNEASCVNAERTLPNELEVASPGETDASWSQDPLGENSPNTCMDLKRNSTTVHHSPAMVNRRPATVITFYRKMPRVDKTKGKRLTRHD